MTVSRPYPECLRRPDRGGRVQTRSPETEDSYRIRYDGMARRLGARAQCPMASVDDVITDVVARAPRLSEQSFRQYRCAILQHLRDAWDEGKISPERVEALEARLRLPDKADRSGSSSRASHPHQATSAGRLRSVTAGWLSSVATGLFREGTDAARVAAGILEHGVRLGLRPSEWFSAHKVGNVLRCRSGKYSVENGRALGETRDVSLQGYDADDLADLADLLAAIARVLAQAGRADLALRRIQAVLRNVRSEIGLGGICLYTSRQQCRANLAAAGLTREEIAVWMGHASADTAGSHYAPARKGWRSARHFKPAPVDDALLARVRPGAKTSAKLRRGQPLTRTEVLEALVLPGIPTVMTFCLRIPAGTSSGGSRR